MTQEIKLPTNLGLKSIPDILDHLNYVSYRTNRDSGCTHEQLVRIGIGNDKFKEEYELKKSINTASNK